MMTLRINGPSLEQEIERMAPYLVFGFPIVEKYNGPLLSAELFDCGRLVWTKTFRPGIIMLRPSDVLKVFFADC